jgi:hypothetical protein
MTQVNTSLDNTQGRGPRPHKSTYSHSTAPGGSTSNLPGDQVEECAKCGGHTIVDDFENVPGIGREKYRKCHTCGSINIKTVPRSPLPVTSKGIADIKPLEETMKKDVKKECKIHNCHKYGSFDGMCTAHFKEIHGISYPDFRRRRKSGETKEQILANSGKKPETKIPTHETKTFSRETKTLKDKIEPAVLQEFESGRFGLVVIFSDHRELFEKLTNMARADFRTEVQQILYLSSVADKLVTMSKARG